MKKNYTTKDFEKLIGKIYDHKHTSIKRAEITKIIEAVIDCKEPMFWLICAVMGLKEGSSYARGARKLKKDFGW